MIAATGIDFVEIERFKSVAARRGEKFLERVFTAGERRYCESMPHKFAHYAARFAAKEAVLKSLGTGWSGGIRWTDVEVVREGSGRTGVRLGGEARRVAKKQGLKAVHVSMSHTRDHATAVAVAER